MRMSTRGRYALRAMVDLARHQEDEPVPREEISRRQDIPSPYLARLLGQLVHAGLIHSERGPGGGYRLARPANEIRAGDIIRATEGSLRPVDCVRPGDTQPCPRQAYCVVTHLWERLGDVIDTFLDEVTLQDLCQDVPRLPTFSVTAVNEG